MTASGWQTAPPQVTDFEVVLVTNSACRKSLEAPSRVPDLPGTAQSAHDGRALTAEQIYHVAPVIDFRSRASAPRTLSAPR